MVEMYKRTATCDQATIPRRATILFMAPAPSDEWPRIATAQPHRACTILALLLCHVLSALGILLDSIGTS